MTFFSLLGAEMHDRRADTIDRELIGAIERKAEPQHLVLVDRLIDHVRAATAPFLGPVHRDVAGFVEPSMVIEELIPAFVVANVEQARGRTAEPFAVAPESFRRVPFEPFPDLGSKFVLFRSVGKIHSKCSAWNASGFRPRRSANPYGRYQTMVKRETALGVKICRSLAIQS